MRRSIAPVAAALAVVAVVSSDVPAAEPEFDGEIRARQSVFLNGDFDSDADDADNFATLRTRVGMRFAAGDHASAYVQFQDTRAFGEPAGTRVSLEQVDLHQGYLNVEDVYDSPLSLRIGRQEMSYGRGRQIAANQWDEVGRSFDGVRMLYDIEDFGFFDLFAMKLRETGGVSSINSGAAVTAGGVESALFGAYLQYEPSEELDVEVYVLDVYRDAGDLFDPETRVLVDENNTANLFTTGARFEYADERVTVYGEGAVQFGDAPKTLADGEVVARDHAGYAAYAGVDYVLPSDGEVESWLGLQVDFASGDDDREDDEISGYVPLFPRRHDPLGAMDLVGWSNVLGVRGRAGVDAGNGWTLWLDYHWFGVVEEVDAWYTVDGPLYGARRVFADVRDAGPVFYRGNESFDSTLGSEIDATARFEVDESLSFSLELAYWIPGDWQEQSAAQAANEILRRLGDPAYDPDFDPAAEAAELDAAFSLYLQTTARF